MALSAEQTALLSAVEVILDASSKPGDRQQAHQVCEQFKTTVAIDECLRSGILLCNQQHAPIVRHFGFQLLCHCITVRWDELSDDVIAAIRQESLGLIQAQGDVPVLQEEPFIKNALSSFVVELIKRLWPQAWPSLMTDLLQLAEMGESQLEIVLMVLQRLAQDVTEFDDRLVSKRRQELRQVLARECNDGLFTFLRQTLLLHGRRAKDLEDTDSVSGLMRMHQRIGQAVLETLTAYLEWVSFAPLFADDGLLLQVLCELLLMTSLQRPAVECLINIVQRKHGKMEEREELLALFRQGPMALFHQATQSTDYFFLKKLTELVTKLGTTQLMALWDKGVKPSVGDDELSAYLDVCLALFSHPGLYMKSMLASFWQATLDHEHLSVSDVFVSRFIPLLQLVAKALVKPVSPFQNNAVAEFVHEDFSDSKEFSTFFSVFRGNLMAVVRSVTTKKPHEVVSLVGSYVKDMTAALGNQEGAANSIHSAVAMRCDGLLCFAEAVMYSIDKLDMSLWPPQQLCADLIAAVLKWDCKDPRVIQAQIGFVEAFFPFLKIAPAQSADALLKLLSVLVFRPSVVDKTTLLGMKRRAGATFVNLCKRHGPLVLEHFSALMSQIEQMWSSDELANSDRTALIEGLVCTIGSVPRFDEQRPILERLLQPVMSLWMQPQLQQAISAPDRFVSFMGLGKGADAEKSRIHRAELFFCLNTFLAVLRRCKLPKDVEAARAGGYPIVMLGNVPVITSVVWDLFAGVVPQICQLLVTFRDLLAGAGAQLLAPDLSKAFDMLLVDKALLLGIDTYSDEFVTLVKESPVVWAQRSVTGIYNTALDILGKCGQFLGSMFYVSEQLLACVCGATLPLVQQASCYRVRLLTRTVVRPMVLACPPQLFQQALGSLLNEYFTLSGQRLKDEWAKMEQRRVGGSARSGEVDKLELLCQEEVVEDAVVCSYAKDFEQMADYITKDPAELVAMAANGDQNEDEESTSSIKHRRALRGYILSTDAVYQPLLLAMLTAVTSPDRLASLRAVHVLINMLPPLLERRPFSEEVVMQVTITLLHGVRLYGQSQANMTVLNNLLTNVFEKIYRTHGAALISTLSDAVGVDRAEVEQVLRVVASRGAAEKKSRDTVKKLLSVLESKEVSQLFRSDIRMPELPALHLPRSKPAAPSIDDSLEFNIDKLHRNGVALLPDDDVVM